MGRDFYIWLLSLGGFGVLGATARYLHDLGRRDEHFSFQRWLIASFVGGTVAIFAGLAARHFEFGDYLTFAIVGASAIAGKEVIEALPRIMVAVAKAKVK